MFSFIHHFSLVSYLILYTKTGTRPFPTYDRVQMHQRITDKFPVAHCALRVAPFTTSLPSKVCSNGYLALDKKSCTYNSLHLSGNDGLALIAGYWADLADCGPSSILFYRSVQR